MKKYCRQKQEKMQPASQLLCRAIASSIPIFLGAYVRKMTCGPSARKETVSNFRRPNRFPINSCVLERAPMLIALLMRSLFFFAGLPFSFSLVLGSLYGQLRVVQWAAINSGERAHVCNVVRATAE